MTRFTFGGVGLPDFDTAGGVTIENPLQMSQMFSAGDPGEPGVIPKKVT